MFMFPNRITAAIDVIKFFDSIKTPQDTEFCKKAGRELTGLEQSVETAAYHVLREYLTGEIDLGDVPYINTDLHNATTTSRSPKKEAKTSSVQRGKDGTEISTETEN